MGRSLLRSVGPYDRPRLADWSSALSFPHRSVTQGWWA